MVILCCDADFAAVICGLWKTAAAGEGVRRFPGFSGKEADAHARGSGQDPDS